MAPINLTEEYIVEHNDQELKIYFTKSMRGKPAIMVNSIRYTVMSENSTNILWRCSYMATKSTKCPARIFMTKQNPPIFVIRNADHKHAEIKRGKYVPNPRPVPVTF